MGFVYTLFILWCLTPTTMRNIPMLVLVASIASVATIVGLNVAQMAQAATNCLATPLTTGNPHCPDPDNPGGSPTNPQGKIVGNPHDVESGIKSGNPHVPKD
jgi:hypothetical protein